MEHRQSGKLKKKLYRTGLLIALVLLLGAMSMSTSAWFVAQVPPDDGKVQVGTLSILVYSFDLSESAGTPQILAAGTNTAGGFDINDPQEGRELHVSTNPVVQETNWQPGDHSAKLIKVVNAGNLNARAKLYFTLDPSSDANAGEVLRYDLIPMEPNATGVLEATRAPNWRSMANLASDAANTPIMTLDVGAVQNYLLVYSMGPCAGNTYQSVSYSADVMLVSTQDMDNAANDIFGP